MGPVARARWRFAVALVIAVLLDLFDYGLGWIPLAGDLVDLIGIVILFPLIGKYAVIPVLEFVPIIGDLLPTFIGAVALAKLQSKGGLE